MATPNQPPETQEEERASNKCLMTEFFKCGRPRCPKQIPMLVSDKLFVQYNPRAPRNPRKIM